MPRDSGWKQKVVMPRDAVTRYTREREEKVFFFPSYLSLASRSARGEEAARRRISLRPALTECASLVCFRIRWDHRVVPGLRWQGIRFSLRSSLLRGMQGEYCQISYQLHSDPIPLAIVSLRSLTLQSFVQNFKSETLTESNLAWAIGNATCFRAKRFRYVNSSQFSWENQFCITSNIDRYIIGKIKINNNFFYVITKWTKIVHNIKERKN